VAALPAVLTEEDKSRIREHMGYPDVRAAASFIVGFPATIETAYLVETAMNEVRVEALPRLRRILDALDRFDEQDVEDLDAHIASKVGEIEINHDEHKLIDSRYDRWLGKLENLLCVSRNPFDKRWAGGGPNSINRPVIDA
jgi:hypothetical protein